MVAFKLAFDHEKHLLAILALNDHFLAFEHLSLDHILDEKFLLLLAKMTKEKRVQKKEQNLHFYFLILGRRIPEGNRRSIMRRPINFRTYTNSFLPGRLYNSP
jgi:hypothetical protein